MKLRWTVVGVVGLGAAIALFAWLRCSKVEGVSAPERQGGWESAKTGGNPGEVAIDSNVTATKAVEFAPLRARVIASNELSSLSQKPTSRTLNQKRASAGTGAGMAERSGLSQPTEEGSPAVGETPEWQRVVIGIGAMLARENGMLLVKGVVRGSPAEEANLTGCAIRTVNGVDVTSLPLQDCVQLIRGVEGSSVTLEIVNADAERQVVQIVRRQVNLESPK